MSQRRRSQWIGVSAVCVAMLIFLGSVFQVALTVQTAMAESSVRPPANAVTNAPMAPGVARTPDAVAPAGSVTTGQLDVRGPNSDATLWGEVRRGSSFTTSIPDPQAASLIQSYGVDWQQIRAGDGVIGEWGANAVALTIIFLLIFYVLRGRIRIDKGFSGKLIERFKPHERFCHWLTAVSFVVLAVTGFNLFYGRELMIPLYALVTSPENAKTIYAWTASTGKWLHNHVAWAFMVGLVLIFVMWVVNNLPTLTDLKWMAKFGGLLTTGVHPPARKFNAGQKVMFWAVILLGTLMSLSGMSMLFPYEVPLFSWSYGLLNDLGAEAVLGWPLPTDLTPVQEMQHASIWHTAVGMAMMVFMVAHIYIGSMGMEGAFDAMGTGMVDRNWAEEHHGLWVEEHDAEAVAEGSAAATPAE